MQGKERLETYLRESKVPFQTQHHPQAFTAQEIAASEHVPGKLLAKVVMVMSDGRLVMLALPAPDHVDLAKANATLGAKETRLAEEGEFANAFPDCEVGAMPPFGNLYDLPIYVDKSLAEDEYLGKVDDMVSVAHGAGAFLLLVLPESEQVNEETGASE